MCCYCEVETSRSNKGSAAKWQATQAHRKGPQSADNYSLSSVATLTTEFQTASGSNVSTRTVRWELHEMHFYDQAAAHKPKITNAQCQASVGVKLAAIGLWSSGNAFFGVMNHALGQQFGRALSCFLTGLHRSLTSTPSNTFGMNWNADCKPGLIAQPH